MNKIKKIAALLVFTISLAAVCSAQAKKTPRPVAPAPVATPTPGVDDTPEITPEVQKKNGRPSSVPVAVPVKNYTPTYFYEYTRPGFVVSPILIEHDAAGTGKISFLKQDLDQMMTDPLQLSPVTVKTINDALSRLDFLSSTTDYQYEKDLPQMGNVKFRYVKDGRERTVKFNWTENPDAKILMDEYRRISNEAVWKFEIAAARVNQPLETPRLMDGFASYLERNEISDPPHLIPFLREIANDERLPLIARNHADRLIKQLEKKKK